MSIDLTPKILLTRESDDEIIDSFAVNWPLLDTAVGARMVGSGVIPPPAELYDGLIVSEAVTGKAWIARSDGSGGYTRSWLVYPWQCYGSNSGVAVGTGTTPTLYGSLTYQSGQSINSGAGDIVGGLMVAPLDGVYELDLSVRWAASAAASSFRSAAIAFNSVVTVSEIVKNESNTPNSNFNTVSGHTVSQFKKLTAGTTLCPAFWQNTGAALNVDYYLRASLVTPL